MANKYEHLRPGREGNPDDENKRLECEVRYSVAERDSGTPTLDFHGAHVGDVEFAMDQFFLQHSTSDAVIFVTGHGTGVIKKAVGGYLKTLSSSPNSPFEEYRMSTSSQQYVVLMKRE